jgi:hypothetical protein
VWYNSTNTNILYNGVAYPFDLQVRIKPEHVIRLSHCNNLFALFCSSDTYRDLLVDKRDRELYLSGSAGGDIHQGTGMVQQNHEPLVG